MFRCYLDGEFQCSFEDREDAEGWCDCNEHRGEVYYEGDEEEDDADGMNGLHEDEEGNLTYD